MEQADEALQLRLVMSDDRSGRQAGKPATTNHYQIKLLRFISLLHQGESRQLRKP